MHDGSELYLDSCQISKKEIFAKIIKPLTVFAKNSILDVSQHSECAFVVSWE